MKRVSAVGEAGLAVHGTYEKQWESILEGGLSKMTRQHVHLALALPPSGGSGVPSDDKDPSEDVQKVVSGIRPSADLYIYLDVPLLLKSASPLSACPKRSRADPD